MSETQSVCSFNGEHLFIEATNKNDSCALCVHCQILTMSGLVVQKKGNDARYWIPSCNKCQDIIKLCFSIGFISFNWLDDFNNCSPLQIFKLD